MVEARVTRGPLPRAWTLAAVAAFGLSSVGCTMCPDPFDYSGPVPNGSSPQNDFRARSNGILPLGAAPKPWPLIVKDESDPATPQDDEPTPTLAEEPDGTEAGGDELQQTVAVVGEAEEEAMVNGHPETAPEAVGPTQTVLKPVPLVAEPTETPQALPQPQVSPVSPPVPAGETPGWRPRRR